MRHLFVCCDGTWATPEKETDGVLTPTNVVRFYNSIAETSSLGVTQLKYYHPGVGTDGTVIDKVVGGGMGVGLGKNIMSAYRWLSDHYQQGDLLFLIGFSRGAYTVRCLSGMISKCGLLKPHAGRPESETWDAIAATYKRGYRDGRPQDGWKQSGWRYHEPEDLEIRFLGVWDTVGARGVPDHLGVADLLDGTEKYRFADSNLASRVSFARHAVAIDELRASFFPTLWKEDAGDTRVEQQWFPGGHSDVGGGWPQTGLSDGALKWMMKGANKAANSSGDSRDDLFEGWAHEQIKPNHLDQIHNKLTGVWAKLPAHPRGVPNFQEDSGRFHKSALARRQSPPIFQAPYWKTHALPPGGRVTIPIYARDPWNATGVWVEPNVEYKFTAEGEWVDKSITCGPDGCRDGDFQAGEVFHLFGSLIGAAEGVFRRVTNNDKADFIASKREEDMPWFTLVGAIANSTTGDHDGTPDSHETFRIGSSNSYPVTRGGYLYCYANDAWGFYENNRGQISLTIERP